MIAYRPVKPGKNGANIPHEVIDLAMIRHADGFGVAWREFGADGAPHLKVEKFGPANRKQFRKALKRVDRSGSEYVAHFRFATQGPRVQSLAHPYEYVDPNEGRVLVFHNGVIDIRAEKHESDTEVFVRDVLATLPSAWWRDPAMRFLVTAAIDWSKLVIMTATETINLHDSRGGWDGGIWYSSEHKAYKLTAAIYGSAIGTQTVIVPPKSAVASAQVLLPSTTDWEFEADTDEWEGTHRARYAPGLMHAGHKVSEIVVIDRSRDGDWAGGVTCDECQTVGDAYVIEGTVFMDLSHYDREGALATPDDDDEDQRAEDALRIEESLERNAWARAVKPGVH